MGEVGETLGVRLWTGPEMLMPSRRTLDPLAELCVYYGPAAVGCNVMELVGS